MNCPLSKTFFGFIVFVLMMSALMMPALAFASAEVDVYEVRVNGSEVSDLDKIYAREDSTITLKFSYAVDGDTSVDGWELRIGGESGTIFNSGSFSGSSAEITFTTEDVSNKDSSSGVVLGASSIYTYTMVVMLKTSEDDSSDITDGDDTSSTTDVGDSPNTELTIRVDMDPPAQVVLHEDPIPGEKSLFVTWDAITESGRGNEEVDVKVKFCVREASQVDVAESTIMFATDGDVTEIAESDIATDGDLDADSDLEADNVDTTEESEADADEIAVIIDGDTDTEVADTELESETDVIVVDGDYEITDGDSESTEEDVETEELEGCMDPVPDGTDGESYRIEDLENGIYYEIRAKSIDIAGNESLLWSEPIYGSPQSVDDFWEAYKKNGGAEDGGFCFLATAAYGSYSNEDVQLLRQFRDKVLMKFGFGRQFVRVYYKYSPPLAKAVADNSFFAFVVRALLLPAIMLLSFAFKLELWTQILIVFVLLGGVSAMFVRRLGAGKEVRS